MAPRNPLRRGNVYTVAVVAPHNPLRRGNVYTVAVVAPRNPLRRGNVYTVQHFVPLVRLNVLLARCTIYIYTMAQTKKQRRIKSVTN